MTRVLVVHHDLDLADQEADSLRRAGYEVEQCAGPTGGGGPCPVLRGIPCPAAERADVLVYDVFVEGGFDGGRALVEGLRRLHPDVPIVLTSPAMELDWVTTVGPARVVPLVGSPTRDRLVAAIQVALADRTASD
jgi:CheY-like chemotaxis protein